MTISRPSVAVVTCLVLALWGGLAAPVRAQDLTDDIIYQPGTLRAPANEPAPAYDPPSAYDMKVAVSDKTLNLILDTFLNKVKEGEAKKKGSMTSATGKRLESLSLSMRDEGQISIEGTFRWTKTPQTTAGTFKFKVRAVVRSPEHNAIACDVLEAYVWLDGDGKTNVYTAGTTKPKQTKGPQLIFSSTASDPGPVAEMLDFLAPGIEGTAAKKFAEWQTKLQETLKKKFSGTTPAVKPAELADLFCIDGNRIYMRILPHLLAPVLPPVRLLWAGVHQRKLTIFAGLGGQ